MVVEAQGGSQKVVYTHFQLLEKDQENQVHPETLELLRVALMVVLVVFEEMMYPKHFH